jgi:hypothetical protein
MKKSKRIRSLKRSVAIATLLVGLAGGAAFAALQSQQNTLTGNTISTATANLGIGSDGVNFTTSQSGFEFDNVVPGGAAVPATGYSFYLKNNGGTPLAIKFYVSSTPSNPGNVDLTKVNVILTTVGTATPQTFTLKSLIDANATGGVQISTANLNPTYSQQYKLQVSMAADALTGSSASLGNIDFSFRGLAQ